MNSACARHTRLFLCRSRKNIFHYENLLKFSMHTAYMCIFSKILELQNLNFSFQCFQRPGSSGAGNSQFSYTSRQQVINVKEMTLLTLCALSNNNNISTLNAVNSFRVQLT